MFESIFVYNIHVSKMSGLGLKSLCRKLGYSCIRFLSLVPFLRIIILSLNRMQNYCSASQGSDRKCKIYETELSFTKKS